MTYRRLAVYYTPPPGALANFGAAWLGWDAQNGRSAAHPDIAALPAPIADLTATPRKYGFHATLKAPFRPAEGITAADVIAAMAKVCAGLSPVALHGGLHLAQIEGFLALIPARESAALQALAADLVRDLDHLRAPLTKAEIARRDPERLSARQRAYLDEWGYPYVMEAFQFHMTLTGPVSAATGERVARALAPILRPMLPDPHPISAVSLMGEDTAGRFHLIERFNLEGGNAHPA
ncbi:DUF1045 domain-containing protein [Paracoccus pacificus]|uniref:DUF1045 domain-containing protein n=1 Tax=Paracoccus pacificus TaxID=1463598 RepID=A0ABW4R7Q2_9RHOB